MSFHTGCGVYMRFLSKLAGAKTFTEMQTHARATRAHRENCPECTAINKPLAEQLFGKKVVVIQEEK